jgi:hypothetical protein
MVTANNLLSAFELINNLKKRVQNLCTEPANGKTQRRQIISNSASAAFVCPLP